MATHALIIGGGIGGLAAGIALRRAGLDVEIFERAPELGEVGAGIGLWANAIHALQILGVADRMEQLAVRTGAGLRTWNGSILIPPVPKRFDAICVHRAELHRALLETFGARGVSLSAQCISVEQDAAGVTARFADGRVVRGDLLIGADGLHSVVRAHLFGLPPPSYAGYVSWRAVTRFDSSQLLPGESWGAGVRFGHFPMSGSQVYWFAVQTTPEGGGSPDGERRELMRLFRGWHAPIPQLIEATDDAAVLRNDTYDRPPLRTWSRGRMTLLGDAAHPMTPNLGQGACQALEDAVVLGRCLAAESDVTAAFRAYESRRVARANALVTRSRQAGWIAQWRHPMAVAARNFLVKHLGSRLERIVEYKV